MHNAMLFHKEERDQNLYSKSLDQIQRKALKVIHLYELIEIYREQFKCQAEMIPENELSSLFYDVFLIIRIITIKVIN